jgi:hypothetical protein
VMVHDPIAGSINARSGKLLVHKTSLTHSLLKCLYQGREVSGHAFVYKRISILPLYYRFWDCSDNVVFFFILSVVGFYLVFHLEMNGINLQSETHRGNSSCLYN